MNYIDHNHIKQFLGRVYLQNHNQHGWLPARWEYATYLVSPLYMLRGFGDWTKTIKVWEHNGDIIGVVNSENPDQNVYIHIDPAHRRLEEEMVGWAEENLSVARDGDGVRQLTIWVNDSDLMRQELLSKLGYQRDDECEYLNSHSLESKLPEVQLPPGYSVHGFNEGVDLERRCACAARAFGSKSFPLDVYHKMQKAPMYRPELDIFTMFEEREVTSFCTVWYDKLTNVGYFEPVGTHPMHRKRGLGKAVLLEGLHRLQRIGAVRAYVGAWGPERRDFYQSAGFVTFDADRPWHKDLIV